MSSISLVGFFFFMFHKLWLKVRHFEQCDIATLEIKFSPSPRFFVPTLVTAVSGCSLVASHHVWILE